MADNTNTSNRSGLAWIIGGTFVAVVLVYILVASGTAPTTGDGTTQTDVAPATETAPVATD